MNYLIYQYSTGFIITYHLASNCFMALVIEDRFKKGIIRLFFACVLINTLSAVVTVVVMNNLLQLFAMSGYITFALVTMAVAMMCQGIGWAIILKKDFYVIAQPFFIIQLISLVLASAITYQLE